MNKKEYKNITAAEMKEILLENGVEIETDDKKEIYTEYEKIFDDEAVEIIEEPLQQTPVNTINNKNTNKFNKQQILGSEKYKSHRDFIYAFLNDDKKYTLAEIDEVIGNYLKKDVKEVVNNG